MNIDFICTFSAQDPEFPFTVGKVYTTTDGVKGSNYRTAHLICDNGKSIRVESSNIFVNEKRQWKVKDHRSYSKYMNYAGFESLQK